MNGRLVARGELRAPETDAMFRLLDRHFAGVSRAQFVADLEEKNWVVLIESDGGDLVGFSTLLYSRDDRGGGAAPSVVSSGDTVMDPRAWTSPVLARTWIRAVRALHAAHGRGTLHWLLLTSGVRTYRFLPLFWRDFYPRYDRATPVETRRLLDRLARERYGERYDRDAGVVRFPRPQRLRGHLPALAPARLRGTRTRRSSCARIPATRGAMSSSA